MSEVPVAVKRLYPATSSARPTVASTPIWPTEPLPSPAGASQPPKAAARNFVALTEPVAITELPSAAPPPRSLGGSRPLQAQLERWVARSDSSQFAATFYWSAGLPVTTPPGGRACFDSPAQRIAQRRTSITPMRRSDWPMPRPAPAEALWEL